MSDKADEVVAEVITSGDRVMSKEDKLERDRMLTEMNRNHAFIGNYGGKAVVSDLVPVADNPGKQRFEFVSVDSIRVRYCNKFVPGSESRAARVALGTWWVNHPYRREYAGVVFEPNGEDTVWLHQKHYLNLWQGWPIEPVQGDWSLMRAHIAMVLADGDPKLEEYILRWFAWAVQNPGKPAEVALVFRGGKGSGKT